MKPSLWEIPMNDFVAIVDYGTGNLFNLQRGLTYLNIRSVITEDKKTILDAGRLILPGVGAFNTGMEYLQQHDMIEPIIQFAQSGRPVLGICLGMQLLMTQSEENGLCEGLNLIRGHVKRFKDPVPNQQIYKIPQIGWNALKKPSSISSWEGTILDGLGDNPYLYFVHSYCVYPDDPSALLAVTEYGRDRFCSVIRQENISGCQFHPERSAEYGLKILKNFIQEESYV